MELKYFHKLSQKEINKLLKEKISIGYIMENFKQPDWCDYPDALSGIMGCWSLMDLNGARKKISIKYCKDCVCFNQKKAADGNTKIKNIRGR